MQDKLEKLFSEVTYHTGKVVSDPQTWSDTDVHGGGYAGGQYGGSVSISSSVTTWTSFVIKKDNGKEYMAKLPYAFPARQGHIVKAADFRGATIAAINEITDEASCTVNTVCQKLTEPEYNESNMNQALKESTNTFIVGIGFCLVIALLITMAAASAEGMLIAGLLLGLTVFTFHLVNKGSFKKGKLVQFLDEELPQRALSKMKSI